MATPKKTATKKTTAKKVTAPRPPAKKKSDPRVIDLDQLKAARYEAAGDVQPPRVRIGGEVYELPLALPASYMFNLGAIQSGDMTKFRGMIEEVFGEYTDEIIAKMDIDDINVFMEKLPEAYDTNSGE